MRRDYIIQCIGDIQSHDGLCIMILNLNDSFIGETNMTSLKYGKERSDSYLKLLGDKPKFFNNENTVYQFGLKVFEDYQKQGWGEKLKLECHKIAWESGYSYITNIVRRDNVGSQKLMNKLEYKRLRGDDIRDLYYYEL
jgi:ribosomal protein S18 acetylase RimI-like enzyme